jgi:hypothetical protein
LISQSRGLGDVYKRQALVNVPEDGVPRAPPLTKIFAPSIETTPAETRARVVSEALPSSRDPTPRAVEVEETSPAIGRPVALVSVPEDGVPRAPPFTTKAPAEPTLTPSAVKTPVPGAVTERAPVPPEVVTRPLVVKLESVEMFCEVLTVMVLVLLVSPVENVSGTSYAPAEV